MQKTPARRTVQLALFLAAAALLVLPASRASAQVLRGRVVHTGIDAPIDSVSIFILQGTTLIHSFETDSLGRFEVQLPAPGQYMLIATRAGFADVPASQFTAPAGRMLDVIVRMGRDVVALEPLVVRARPMPRNSVQAAVQRIEENRRFGIGVHMTRDEIEKSTRTDVLDLIQSMTPSIRMYTARPGMVANGRGGYAPTGLSSPEAALAVNRFGKLCPLKLYLDGVDVTDGGLYNLIHPDEIGAVEVYLGPFARAGYYDSAGCGIALVWSGIHHKQNNYRRTWLGSGVLIGLVGIVLLVL